MLRPLCLLLSLLILQPGYGQESAPASLYFVGFSDKAGTPYSTEAPLEFLSQRALDRRAKIDAAVTEMDLPVAPAYEQQVLELGADIWLRSKWMNGVVVKATRAQLARITALPFVDTTFYTAPAQYPRSARIPPPY